MKFCSVVFVASQALSSSRALQILSDVDVQTKRRAAVGPSDAKYNAIFDYIQRAEDGADAQIAKVDAFLALPGADGAEGFSAESGEGALLQNCEIPRPTVGGLACECISDSENKRC